MKLKTLLPMLTLFSLAQSQESDFTRTLNIAPDFPDTREFVLLEIREIYSAVAFNWPPTIAGCPTIRHGEFVLKKINPSREYLVSKPVCPADGKDSASFNTSFVYEIPTAHGALYYMTILEADMTKVKVRITREKPAAVLQKSGVTGKGSSNNYLSDGKAIGSHAATNKTFGK